MKMIRDLLLSGCLCGWTLHLCATTLFFAGDSTLDDNGRKPCPPYESWGTELEWMMRPGCQVRNFAKSGASSRSFRDSGLWARLMSEVQAGDFVAIQFGANDQKRSTPFYREKRWANPKGLFREIIRDWVTEVKEKGATPILLSPICRGTFDAAGKRLVDVEHRSEGVRLESYRDAMEDLAREMKCDFVDMNHMTRDLMERLGKKAAHDFFVISTGMVKSKDGEPSKDTTHPVKAGARAFARLFLDDVTRRKLPVASLFRRVDFNIAEFGAKPDGVLCTGAFRRAMEECHEAGGGRVVVPAGKWQTGAIRFKSNCELFLSEGAEVLFSENPDDYLPAVHTSWEGMECWNYCPLVYAYCCTNVAITGCGTLKAYDGEWKDTRWYPWVLQEGGVKAARLQLYTWGATDHPVEKRQIWKLKDAHTRPHFVQFNRCKDVRWEGFKVRNSPFWTLHLYLCENAVVKDLDVSAHGTNNDGIDIEMSRHVRVDRCRFDQGDDGVVIKSGRNRDAWRVGMPTEDVLVRDCEILNAHTLLGIGSEISGGVRNVRLENCRGGNFDRVLFVKTNRRRGGFVEDVVIDGVQVGKSRFAVASIWTDVLYEWADFPDYELRTTRIRNIVIRNVSCEEAERRVSIRGDAKLPVANVRIENLLVGKVRKPDEVAAATGVSVNGRAVPALFVGLSDVCNANRTEAPRCYAEALRKTGHVPVLICRNADTNALRSLVRQLDLVLFTGGEDVNPARYGAERSGRCGSPNESRDEFDFALMAACVAERKPMLGVCRGCQVMNSFFGGTLYQDIPSEYVPTNGEGLCVHSRYPYYGGATNPPLHKVSALAGSRFAEIVGTEPLEVNSHHHQGVRDLAPGFRATAWATDGFVEVFEHQSYPAVGIQFHPENTVAYEPRTGFDVGRQAELFRRIGELVGIGRFEEGAKCR